VRQAARGLVEAIKACGAVEGSGPPVTGSVSAAVKTAIEGFELVPLVVTLFIPATMREAAKALGGSVSFQGKRPGPVQPSFTVVPIDVQEVPILAALDPDRWYVAARVRRDPPA
jgi:hypothetical protein